MFRYKNRWEAGDKLAGHISKKGIHDAIVIGIPRGGVVVAARVSEKLGFPLDIIIPRKIPAPFNPEFAVGAVTQDGTTLLNRLAMNMYNITEKDLEESIHKQVKEIKRRMTEYRGNADYPQYKGKTIILVDDGIATGFTVKAAIKSIKKMFAPSKLILAVPVAPPEAIENIAPEVDEIVCPLKPDNFYAVGQFYESFEQILDEEVRSLLSSGGKVNQ